MEEILTLFFACLFSLAVAVPLFLWLTWWEDYLRIMDKGLTTAEIFRKAADR